jgi:hypothetical protein
MINRREQRVHWVPPVITAMCLIITFGFWMFLDILLLVSTSWIFLIIALLIGVLISYLGLSSSHYWRTHVALLALYAAAVFALFYMDLTPAKPFHRFYDSIRPGMSVAEVQQLLDRHFPTNGGYPKPVSSGIQKDSNREETLSFQLDPNQGAYNAELVGVRFSNGQVVDANYSPD